MIIEDVKLDYSDVLIVPQRSFIESRAAVTIVRDFIFDRLDKSITGTGLIAANMDTIGTIPMARAMAMHNSFCALHKFHKKQEVIEFREENSAVFDNSIFIATGTNTKDWEWLYDYATTYHHPNLLCIDVANGHRQSLANYIREVRNLLPKTIIMAGNVVTTEGTGDLFSAGANIVKVGIGPGSVCTTRKMTGVGYPQLSAVMETSERLKLDQYICADGGCTVPGDICKALIGGAEFVMLGSMLAGHDESSVGTDVINGKVPYYGMASKQAMVRHHGGVASYRASEGKSVLVDYKGPVENTLLEILGGIRSMMSYVGVHNIQGLSGSTTFARVNRQLNNIFS